MAPLDLAQVRSSLFSSPPVFCSEPGRTRAAVTLLLRGDPVTHIFFIVRARHADDPWSGDIGFPGGKIEPGETPLLTATRETAEEVGIDLDEGALLGYLEPIRGAHLPIDICGLVFHLDGAPKVTHNHEVAESFWLPVERLLARQLHGRYPVRFGSERLIRPGIRILPEPQPVLWGITYRLLRQFLAAMQLPFPAETTAADR